MFAKKQLQLDGDHNLNYMQEGAWSLASISTRQDVTILEAFNFLEKVKDGLMEQALWRDPTQLTSADIINRARPFNATLSQSL